jgi:phytoene synthase
MPNSQSLIPNPDLDADVRRYDEDRWLASRFAPAQVRARLITIYALNHEIARTAETVSSPALGDIRFAWWREALAEIADGNAPRAHPALQAYAQTQQNPRLAHRSWEILLDARARDFEAAPFRQWADVEAYIDNTAGGVMRMALAACDDRDTPLELAAMASRAWGYAGLLRAAPGWAARGRSPLPREGGSLEDMRQRARLAYGLAQALARESLAAAGFPAIGYAALIPGYLRALERGRIARSLFARQINLIAAAAAGRL